ncbi:hypothetical protein HSBAA_62650 [Vreelandella sulfidaeris]|uniref:Mechanosensitive ion channel inner membrane domain-containing protein n=1 Tax=Vreelandella sulfidaeris TaxID=115553 RepID=A0A455UL35_9GAMM|nr:hypothetical protein HSBAA_62650 [Halomonas sulfidaeris]
MKPLRLLPWLAAWLLVMIAIMAMPAMAQSTATEPASAEEDAAESAESSPTSYEALANLLEDEQARQELIEMLRSQASALPDGIADELSPEAAAQGSEIAPEDVSLPRQLAELTSRVVSDVGGQFEQVVSIVGELFTGQEADSVFDMAAFISAAINLGIVIVATFAMFMIFRRLAKPLFTKISGWSLNGTNLTPVLRLIACVAIAAIIDVLLVAFAYVGGNLLATFAIGEAGELSTRASLFLNAFLIIELLKAGVRMLFSSRYEGLRLLPISAQEASYWNRWLARLIGMVGYGLMVVVPLVNFYVAASLGQAIGTLIMLLAFIYAVVVVLKNRKRLRDNLNDMAAKSTLTASRVSLQLFARTWHLFALLYFFDRVGTDVNPPRRCAAVCVVCYPQVPGCDCRRVVGIVFPYPDHWPPYHAVRRPAAQTALA